MADTPLHEQIRMLLLALNEDNKRECMQLIMRLQADEMPRYLDIMARKANQLQN